MWQVEKHFKVIIGGATFIDTPNMIAYRGESLFRLYRKDDGYLAIDLAVYDVQRNKIASVVKNNIYGANPERYRLEGTADTVRLHEIKGSASLVTITKRPYAVPAELEIYLETYLPNGILFSANPASTNFAGLVISGVTLRNCVVGINID